MATQDFKMELQFPVSPQTLYDQFATQEGVQHWWTKFCEMDARVGGQAEFRFPKAGFFAKVKILKLEPPQYVGWECIDQTHPERLGFNDLHDWIGTKMTFQIEPVAGDKSKLTFTHVGLAPLECAEACSSSWSYFLNQSLRQYLTTGKGEPDEE